MPPVRGLPPGPGQSPIVQWAQWVRNPIGFLEQCSALYGPTFTVRFPWRPPTVWFADPSAAESIFATERDSFEARAATAGNVFSAFVGDGSLLMMTSARHRNERRLLDPLFHGQRLANYEESIREVTDAAIVKLPKRQAFPLYPALEEIATGINVRSVLGPAGDEPYERLKELFFQYVNAMTPLPLSRLTTAMGIRLPSWGRKQALIELKTAIYSLLGREIAVCRRQNGSGREDILAKLVAARDEDSQTPQEAEARVCDQLLTFLIAGHGSTATSLSWTLAHILESREVQERVRQEIRQVFGDEFAHPARSAELRYLDAVIKETLRLHPPFLLVTRLALNPVSLGGYELPAGTPVALSAYLMHRRPDLWDNPDEFRPERFLERRPSPFAYFPFGGGHRVCTANTFAPSLSRGVLSRLLSRATLRLRHPKRMRPVLWRSFTFPQGGPPVIVDDVIPIGTPR